MDINALQAAARAKLAGNSVAFIDPTDERALPLIVQKVVPQSNEPTMAKNVLQATQAQFTVLVNNTRYMFNNYRFETNDNLLAAAIVGEYAPRIWRV